MPEKRQAISAREDESGKEGAVFLPYYALARKIKIKIKGVCLGADRFAFGELLGKVESRTIPK
jgi:hypothetical protein